MRKPYLLILHGGPGFSAHSFYFWGESLERTFNVVYLDQRGSGESERLDLANLTAAQKSQKLKNYSMTNLVKDIEGVRKLLKINKWYVLGFSWGGMLGVSYVARENRHTIAYFHLDGLISQPLFQDAIFDAAELESTTSARSAGNKEKAQADEIIQMAQKGRALPLGEERLFTAYKAANLLYDKLYFSKPEFRDTYRKQLLAGTKKYTLPQSAYAFASEPDEGLILNNNYPAFDVLSLLPKITVPTLIINGKQDNITPVKIAEITHAKIKNSNLLLLDNCGHLAFIEQPEKVTTSILEFVKVRE